MRLKIRQLQLRGIEKDYGVSFVSDEGTVEPLSTIAGEISTGKTSVFEFVEYCLGGSSHPVSIEVKRQARAAMLEVDFGDQTVVIERPLFGPNELATVRYATLADIDAGLPHEREMRPVEPTGSPDSLSSLLLSQVGLAGISLKEAPTQKVSGADPLSFRDLMWLCYLSADRHDAGGLLFEQSPPKHLKLRQVIEVVFDVYDDREAKIADALRQLEDDIARARADAESLERFLKNEEVPSPIELASRHERQSAEYARLTAELAALTEEMRAASGYADEVRSRFSERQREANETAAQVRYQETLIRRLVPLEAQYIEDERKLVFFKEAERLFDPLQLIVCPACLQTLEKPVSDEGAECSLCHQPISREAAEDFDINAELRAVKARHREVSRYLNETRAHLDDANARLQFAREAETAAQRELDDEVAGALSPFLAQREQVVRNLEEMRSGISEIERQQRWQQTLDRRYAEIERLNGQATELRSERAGFEGTRTTKQDVVADLQRRFDEILRRFDFPKLDDPSPPTLDAKSFVPYVRGISYREETSRGALTLIAVAWQLAIFERAIELGEKHPGFLLIDSPQQGLAQPDERYQSEQIRVNVWNHLLEWSRGVGATAQIIVAENTPPAIADDTVVVRYGGRYGPPPYGLIDNETSHP